MSIQLKQIPPTFAITVRQVVQERNEIQTALTELAAKIPFELVAGPPFCVFHFITSVTSGDDVTLGFPVHRKIDSEHLRSEWLPQMEVLALIHRDNSEPIGATLREVFGYASKNAIISDEFYREVYLGDADPGGPGIEIQFVIHNWNARLANGLERILGPAARETVMQGAAQLEIESGVAARFEWVKGMLARLDSLAGEYAKWDILSGCAHVFPPEQISKLAAVFSAAKAQSGNVLQAMDAVIAFMDSDPGWAEGGVRKGYIIYAAKKPRDPRAYAAAQTDLERRQAYCFCPLVRTRLDQGMPVDFCHCGSGWFRQQWEGATGRPVRVETVRSVLRGDEKCEFAIHLSPDL